MKDVESHSVLSASWRTRSTASIWIWKPKDLGAKGVSPSQSSNPTLSMNQCPRAGDDGCPSSRRELILPSSTFGSIQASINWKMSTHTGESHLLYSVYWFKCYSLLERSVESWEAPVEIWPPRSPSSGQWAGSHFWARATTQEDPAPPLPQQSWIGQCPIQQLEGPSKGLYKWKCL